MKKKKDYLKWKIATFRSGKEGAEWKISFLPQDRVNNFEILSRLENED